MTTAALLSVEAINAYYGQFQALHGLSLALQEGSVTTLLGANGAGKSTTLRAICNMVRTSGRATFAGRSLIGLPTQRIARLGVAHVPQGRGTFSDLTVDENLRLGAISRSDLREIEGEIDATYTRFRVLGERRQQQAGLLSGGEQQMLAVARALMLRPRLLLLDEPSFGLAPKVVRELFEILAVANKESRTTILIVEQNAELALAIATQAYVIETGRIVMSGPAADIVNDEAIRRSYLGQ